jgi:glycerophosphoryl diester phosphodiesterase
MLELRRARTGRVQVIGHRGAMGYAPENTLPSFELGLRQGAQILELDVHLSRDGAVVVIHDVTLERTTDGAGYIGDHTLADLKRLDAGVKHGAAYAGTRIPTLGEVLDWARGRAALAVEIKASEVRYEGIEARVVDLLARHGMIEHVLVISFDHTCLYEVKRLQPNVATGALYLARPVDPAGLMQAAHADVMRPHWAYVTEEEVRVARENGWAIAPWGATESRMWRHLWALGVDVISANHPDRLVSTLVELQNHDQDSIQ